MSDPRDYEIVCRFLIKGEGWQEETIPFHGTYVEAGRRAAQAARELDAKYGDTQFWTVDLYTPSREFGSYYQLFHGRLS